MTQPIVLVIFYSQCGHTEKLALAAAVGAVQGRASIRLRRLPDIGEVEECREALERMQREYIAPGEMDVLGADALLLASPPNLGASSAEWTNFLALLRKLRSEGKLPRMTAAAVHAGNDATLESFNQAIIDLGFSTLPPDHTEPGGVERAAALGRNLAAVSRDKVRR